jgi:replication factor A1
VDILAVVTDVSDVMTISKETTKRDIMLLDQTGCTVRWTLWGKAAEQTPPPEYCTIVAIRHACRSDLGTVSLTGANNWENVADDKLRDFPGAAELKEWWDANFETAVSNARSLTRFEDEA